MSLAWLKRVGPLVDKVWPYCFAVVAWMAIVDAVVRGHIGAAIATLLLWLVTVGFVRFQRWHSWPSATAFYIVETDEDGWFLRSVETNHRIALHEGAVLHVILDVQPGLRQGRRIDG